MDTRRRVCRSHCDSINSAPTCMRITGGSTIVCSRDLHLHIHALEAQQLQIRTFTVAQARTSGKLSPDRWTQRQELHQRFCSALGGGRGEKEERIAQVPPTDGGQPLAGHEARESERAWGGAGAARVRAMEEACVHPPSVVGWAVPCLCSDRVLAQKTARRLCPLLAPR